MKQRKRYIFERIDAMGNGPILFGYPELSAGVPDKNNPTLFLDAWRVDKIAFSKGDVVEVEYETESPFRKTRVWHNGKLVFELTPEIEESRANSIASWVNERKTHLRSNANPRRT